MPPKKKTVSLTPSTEPATGAVRLQKILASAGLGSRRKCEEYILTGRVTVDGETVSQLGSSANPATQDIRVDDQPLKIQLKKYYLLNKPKGVLCTNRDPGGRRRVIDLFPPQEKGLFTVGRLDENSEGLLLVTNDGDLANRLAHPRYRVQRTYHVQVAGQPSAETLAELKKGIYFAEGKFQVEQVKQLRRRGQSTFLELVLREGQNREIRRLMARVGHKVISLKRVRFGPLTLGRLSTGNYRALRPAELKMIEDYFATAAKRRPIVRKKASAKKAPVKQTPVKKSATTGSKERPASSSRKKSASPRKGANTPRTGKPSRKPSAGRDRRSK